MNSRVEPEVICGPLSDTASSTGRLLVVGADVDSAVLGVAGLDGIEQPLGLQRGGKGELDLGGGFLDRDDLGETLTRDQVGDDEYCHPAAGKCVVS